MQVRGIDSTANWIHVAARTCNFVAADLELYERIREIQRTALAVRAEQEMNAAY
jgi:hypothetical protein